MHFLPTPQSLAAGLASAVLLASLPAMAAPVTLEFNLKSPSGKPITDVFIYSTAPGEAPSLLRFGYELAPSGVQTITYDLPFEPAETLISGIYAPATTGNSGVIMFLDPAFAFANQGIRFGQMFPMGEQAFVRTATAAHDGDPDALAALEVFFASPQVSAARFDAGGPFIIGHFSLLEIPEASVNATWLVALGVAGLGAHGWMRRRN